MIFLMQFGVNKHSQIFQRLQIALALQSSPCAFFCSLKNLLVLFTYVLFLPKNSFLLPIVTIPILVDYVVEDFLSDIAFDKNFFKFCFNEANII